MSKHTHKGICMNIAGTALKAKENREMSIAGTSHVVVPHTRQVHVRVINLAGAKGRGRKQAREGSKEGKGEGERERGRTESAWERERTRLSGAERDREPLLSRGRESASTRERARGSASERKRRTLSRSRYRLPAAAGRNDSCCAMRSQHDLPAHP